MKFGHLGSAAWLLIGAAAALRASDGTWIAPGGGVWSDTANWQDQAVAEGCTELWELAERFDVTEEFVRKAVCLYVHGNLATELYF